MKSQSKANPTPKNKQIHFSKSLKKPSRRRNSRKSSNDLPINTSTTNLNNTNHTNNTSVNDWKQSEMIAFDEMLQKTNFRTNKIYSKSWITPYIPLSMIQKVKVMNDMDEQSSNRFIEYSKIFESIKQEISGINSLHLRNYQIWKNNHIGTIEDYIEETWEEDKVSPKLKSKTRGVINKKTNPEANNEVNCKTQEDQWPAKPFTRRNKNRKNFTVKFETTNRFFYKDKAKDCDDLLFSTEENKNAITLSSTETRVSLGSIRDKNRRFKTEKLSSNKLSIINSNPKRSKSIIYNNEKPLIKGYVLVQEACEKEDTCFCVIY